ncbi:MAG: hypothetical protein IIA66_11050 [Planctomycetes bacterium]|nr:hypothetical protein [Planctomycetota bacterium]
MYDGGRMYIDCWENKPPGLAWINALALASSGGWEVAPWILPGVVAMAVVVVLWWASREILGLGPAISVTFLAAVLVTTRDYDTPSINPDFYCAMFVLLATSLLFVALFGSAQRPRLLSSLSGLCWAAAATFKQTGPLGLLAFSMIAIGVFFVGGKSARKWRNLGLLTWLGFLMGLLLVVGLLLWRGTMSEAMHAIFGFNKSLLTPRAFWESLGGWNRNIGYLKPLELPLWLGLIAIAAAVLGPQHRPLPRATVLALALWWVAEEWFALVGPSKTMRYVQATWPPMLWLVGCGVAQIVHVWQETSRDHRWMLTIAGVTLILFLGIPLKMQYFSGLSKTFAAYDSSKPSQRDQLREIGRYVQEYVSPGQKIYVLSYDTGIYLYADRASAVRFTNVRDLTQELEMIQQLESGTANALLVPRNENVLNMRFSDQTVDRLKELFGMYETKGDIGAYRLMVLRDDL